MLLRFGFIKNVVKRKEFKMFGLFRLSLKLRLAIDYAKRYIGTVYKWGGDDPSGFDCSGFVLEVLQAIGIIESKSDYTADALLRKLNKNEVFKPYKGCLWFKINMSGKATHVELCLDRFHSIGAKGGDRTCIDAERALALNAFIKIRPIPFDLSQKDRGVMKIVFIDPFMELRRK